MNNSIKLIFLFLFSVLIINTTLIAQEEQITIAKQFIQYLSRYDHDKAIALVDNEKKHVITSELLSFFWKIIIKERGDLKNIESAKQETFRDEKGKSYKAVHVYCTFSNAKGIVIIIFNDKDKIYGLAYTNKKGETVSFAMIN